MDALRILPHYTYDDYVHWEGRWELIEGIPFAMSPSPNFFHQQNAALITAAFVNALRDCKGCRVYQPVDYKVADDIVLQPDMLVVCGVPPKQVLESAPALVVEILSPSSASVDRLYKYNLYQREGIRYYLIIDVNKEIVEIYMLRDGRYVLAATGRAFQYTFDFPEGCPATIDFNEIWQ